MMHPTIDIKTFLKPGVRAHLAGIGGVSMCPLAEVLLGMGLHQFVIRTAEVDMVMFGRAVYWPSYVYSAVLTILFGMLVNLVMHHKLKKISMVESMKAPE